MIGTILHQLLADDNGADIKDPAARQFFKRFKERREDVVARYFSLFNSTIFDNKLPWDLQVEWKNRLLKTAGFCVQELINETREAHIELASKVCDTPERIRDVLVHEMCHAASWMVDGIRDCHGPGWRYWADKVNETYPELPPVNPYHEYTIATKYVYRCTRCGLKTGRHTKSVDITRFVCGQCRGRIELLRVRRDRSDQPTTLVPRRPSTFAMFVRQNYQKTKRRKRHLSSKEIMQFLSAEYSRKKNGGKGDGTTSNNYRKSNRKRRRRSEELSKRDIKFLKSTTRKKRRKTGVDDLGMDEEDTGSSEVDPRGKDVNRAIEAELRGSDSRTASTELSSSHDTAGCRQQVSVSSSCSFD